MKCSWLALLFSTAISGCHVVDRAERCGALSAAVKKAAPEIAKTPIPDSPPSTTLRKKARLYAQLAEDLGTVQFHEQEVKDGQQGLIVSLVNLERHLLEAASAIEEQTKFIARQSQAKARHEEMLAQKRAYAAKMEQSNAGSSPSPTPSPPRSAQGTDETSPRPVARELPRLVGRARERGADGAVSPPSSARPSPHSYSYDRAKRAAESASRAVEAALRSLEAVCR